LASSNIHLSNLTLTSQQYILNFSLILRPTSLTQSYPTKTTLKPGKAAITFQTVSDPYDLFNQWDLS